MFVILFVIIFIFVTYKAVGLINKKLYPLSGFTVGLDAGHGKIVDTSSCFYVTDSGKQYYDTGCFSDSLLDICKENESFYCQIIVDELKNKLEKQGAKVVCSDRVNYNAQSLNEISIRFKPFDTIADIIVSIHFDSFDELYKNRTTVFIWNNDIKSLSLASFINNELSDTLHTFALLNYDISKSKIYPDSNLNVLKYNLNRPTCLVEVLNLKSRNSGNFMRDKGVEIISQSIFIGIQKYLLINRKKKKPNKALFWI